MRNAPEIIDVDSTRLEEVLRRVEPALDAQDFAMVRAVFESYAYLADLVEDKTTSIRRLRQLLFGACTETTTSVVGRDSKKSGATPQPDAGAETGIIADDPETNTPDEPSRATAARGHGRHGADAYRGAVRSDVPHPSLAAGDACPACGQGTVYEQAPGVLVRITGQPPLTAKVYALQKLRCHLCGQVFTAAAPEDAGDQKYEATAGSMIGLLKYGSGLPFNRLDGLQGQLGVPLPASTQWDIVHAVAANIAPAFAELLRQAAQGDVLHNDDTTVKILELMGQRRRPGAPVDAGREMGVADERSGLYTSGVVALRDGHRVALFFSGRRHAGENLAEVLNHRAVELPPPIQMCDALSRNLPGELQTILANCLAHARRQFVDVFDRFPEPCRHLLESLAVVYHNDALAREQSLSPEARLQFHREKSQPTMSQLHDWLTRQLGEKWTEPNSALGHAIGYMLRHWDKLTLFLRQAGAPLDNNLCERALKKAILHRKNALFYKTRNGARVGDLFMSLIYTCELNQTNAFDYLPSCNTTPTTSQPAPISGCPGTTAQRWRERCRTKSVVRIGALTIATPRDIEAMSKPKKPAPARKQPGSSTELRRALTKRKKLELVDVLMELAQADRGVLRQLTARFDVATTPDELVGATRQAIADATAFDERDINRNFDYDYEAYDEVERNLVRMIASGQLRLAMQLALDLMKRGSYQVEMSDEGLMTEDIEDCLSVVIEAVTKCDLPADEVLAWCSAMLTTDRMGFIAREPLEALRRRVQAAKAR